MSFYDICVLLLLLYIPFGGCGLYLLYVGFRTDLTENERRGLKSSFLGYTIIFIIGLILFGIYFSYEHFEWAFFNDSIILTIKIFIVCIPIVLGVIYACAPEEGDDKKIIETKEKIIETNEKIDKNTKTMEDFYRNNTFIKTFEWTEGKYSCTFCVDDTNDQFIIVKVDNFNLQTPSFLNIPFSSIIKCEIDEDGQIIERGGVGRAVVGGIIAGQAGAIVGAVTRKSEGVVNSLCVKIFTSEINHPQYIVSLIFNEISKDSQEYKQKKNIANEIYATILAAIQNQKDTEEINKLEGSTYDIEKRLLKLKSLKDHGIITEEEYAEKRKSIIDEV